MPENILTLLQEDIAARLAADAYFADIPVVTERQGDIAQRVAKALAPITAKGGKSGVCVIVNQFIAKSESANVSSPLLTAVITCEVIENVIVNTSATGTHKAALSVATAVLNCLHQYAPAGLAGNLIPDPNPIVPAKDPLGLAYDVQLSARVADPQVLVKVATPTITATATTAPATVTIACTTADSTILYSTDGTPPYAGQQGVSVYTAPIALQAACTVLAAAQKPGCITSNRARLAIL